MRWTESLRHFQQLEGHWFDMFLIEDIQRILNINYIIKYRVIIKYWESRKISLIPRILCNVSNTAATDRWLKWSSKDS